MRTFQSIGKISIFLLAGVKAESSGQHDTPADENNLSNAIIQERACDPENPSFDFGDDDHLYDKESFFDFGDDGQTMNCKYNGHEWVDLTCVDGKFKAEDDKCPACDPNNPSFEFGGFDHYYDKNSYEFTDDGWHKMQCLSEPSRSVDLFCVDGKLQVDESYPCPAHTQQMDHEEKLNAEFKLYDINHDNALDKEEVAKMIHAEIHDDVTSINDKNLDGRLSIDEGKGVEHYLELTDSDNDGFYSRNEIRLTPVEKDENGFPKNNGFGYEQCFLNLVDNMDADGDTKVSFAEWTTEDKCSKTEEDWVDINGNDCTKYREAGWCDKYSAGQMWCVSKDFCSAQQVCSEC